jgi:hypothetical protein
MQEMMKVGDVVHLVYQTGEVFTGPLVRMREIEGKGTLLLVNDENVGHRSVYAHKCVGPISFRSSGKLTPD